MTQKTHSLSALDLAIFVLETPERMCNTGPLAILKPPPRTRNPGAFADRLLREMKKRPVGAPFNRIYHPPGLKGLPKLETIEEIDLDAHCHRHTLSPGSSDEDLMAFVCRLHEPLLDRSRPPWEFHIIDGLQGGRIALYGKVHHGIIDGRAFVEVCTRWFQADAANKEVRAMWEGLPQRHGAAGTTAKTRLESAAQTAMQTTKTMASLYAGLARQALASTGFTQGMPLPFLGTSSDLGGKPSVRRILAYCMLPLKAVKAFGKAHDASVNDVLLTVLDMALTRYVEAKGRRGRTQPLVADMPVALNTDAGGNAIAVLQFHLGAAGASPLERLAQIKQRTAEVKEHVRRTDASALITYTAAVHGIPALLEALRVPKAPMLANAVISNPFGMPYRAYLAGTELEMILPVSMLVPGQSLNITAVTYAEQLQIAFLGLEAQMPDIGDLATFTTEAFAELRDAAGATKAKDAPISDTSETATPLDPAQADWRETWAHLVGMQAYAYGFPAIYYTKLRYGTVKKPQGVVDTPLNTLFHIPRLSDHTDLYGGSPMRDAIYSTAWLDLRGEPVVVHSPASGKRYVSIQLAEFYSDLFGYVGPSVNGGRAQTALVVGPQWKGKTPAGVDVVLRSPTPSAFLVARVSTPGGDDLAAARALQQGSWVKPLSAWRAGRLGPDVRDVLTPFPPTVSLADFRTMNAAMRENPPPARDEALMRQFAQVGLGPLAPTGIDDLDPATQRGLARALVDGPKLLAKVALTGGNTKQVDGWFYGDKNWGRMAAASDFLGRASPQAFSGIIEHWIEQSTKLRTFVDADGQELSGQHRYMLRFTKDEIPEARAFWSITLYDERFNLADNPIKRYSIGSLTKGLVYGANGSLEFLLQHERPAAALEANWLPTPAGKFNLFLRTYLPGPGVMKQRYVPPMVRKL